MVQQNIRYDKTLAYDLFHLIGERKLTSTLEKYEPYFPENITITLYKEDLIKHTNNYKLLYEFVAEVLQKSDFTIFDLVNFYHRKVEK